MTPTDDALPKVVSAEERQRALSELTAKEKAHTRAGDALSAARRRASREPLDAPRPHPLRRRENWEDSPAGWPQTEPYGWNRRQDDY